MTALSDLIPLLFEKTEERKLQWEDLSGSGKSFIATLGDWRLEIFRNGVDTQLFLRNEAGLIIEAATYQSLPPPIDDQLVRLQALARRNALKVDDALDSLRSSLTNL